MQKKKGTQFEKEFAVMLFNAGFWVRLDKGTAQTCDIIAGKNNVIYLFECKTCIKDYFDLNRIEDNQRMSRRMFKVKGNDNAYFAFKVEDKIYLSKEPIKKPSEGVEFNDWIHKQ